MGVVRVYRGSALPRLCAELELRRSGSSLGPALAVQPHQPRLRGERPPLCFTWAPRHPPDGLKPLPQKPSCSASPDAQSCFSHPPSRVTTENICQQVSISAPVTWGLTAMAKLTRSKVVSTVNFQRWEHASGSGKEAEPVPAASGGSDSSAPSISCCW